MTFLDWIQRVEKLHPNFEEWQGDETGRLLQKLAAKLNTEVPSEEVINGMEEFAKLQIDDIVQAIEDVYGQLDCMALSVDKQKALQMRESFVENKHVFNIKVYREMLNHKQWFVLRKETNESVSRILLHLYVVYEERVEPRLKSKEYSVNTIIAFQVKAMLTRIALCTWGTMVDMGGINSFMFEYKMPSSKKTKLPLDLYIPIMRRLGMMDILDPDWNTDGEWYEILGESLQKAGDGPIQKIKADEILQRRSTIWRKTRNSFSCRRMAVSPKFIKHLPPTPFSQCFQYFPKCSVNECPNIETRKSPHPIRCKKCWYFHCCSPGEYKQALVFMILCILPTCSTRTAANA